MARPMPRVEPVTSAHPRQFASGTWRWLFTRRRRWFRRAAIKRAGPRRRLLRWRRLFLGTLGDQCVPQLDNGFALDRVNHLRGDLSKRLQDKGSLVHGRMGDDQARSSRTASP